MARRLRECYADAAWSIRKTIGNGIDYFEWLFHQFFEGIRKAFSCIGALFFSSRWFETLRKKQAQRVDERVEKPEQRGGEKFIETLEYLFHLFAQGVSNTFNGMYRLFVPTKLIESTEQAFKYKAVETLWVFHYRFKRLVERLSPRWLTKRLRPIGDVLFVLGTLFSAWVRSRDYEKLAWSTPAILLGLPLILAIALSPMHSTTDKIQHYRLALNAAIDENNNEARDLYLRKLDQLGYRQMERAEFQAALALSDDDKWQEAYNRMLTIAPVTEPGFPLAHVWIAGALVEGRVVEDNRWALVETHAEHVLAEDVDNPYAFRFLAYVDLQKGDTDTAIAEMEMITGTFPDLHAKLMDLTRLQGNFSEARKHARKAVATFEDLQRDDNGLLPLTAIGFLRWGRAYELLGNKDDMTRTLELGIARYPQDATLRKALATILSSQVAKLDTNDPNAEPLLKRILALDQLNQAALLMLIRGLVSEDETTRRFVSELKSQDLLPSDLFLSVGDLHARSGNYERAIDFYKETSEIDPNSARAWNNIAWIWSNIEPLKIDEALDAVMRSIAIDPNTRFFETRGQIYFKLGRWPEAASDLERALNGTLSDSDATHLTLARVYEQLGNVEQAAAHRRLATRVGSAQ